MKNFILPIEKLVASFSRLPGVGRKTAVRYAYYIINSKEADVRAFAQSMVEAKETVHYCRICGNFTDKDVCDVCKRGDKSVVCVVAEPKDILALEKVSDYVGTFHVLHGLLNPLDNVTPKDIRIKELLERISVDGVHEVIMATNPTVEGEATAIYIGNLLKPLGVKVTRIAQGVSLGTDIEFVDEVTLTRALEDRREI
ncbi:MAG: recombination protein RecR [Clostridia bacterium]|nr:recombination protein RecR [Clostridia bacterium]